MKTVAAALLSVCLLGLAPSLSAQDAEPTVMHLTTKAGEVMAGEFRGLDGDKFRMTVHVLGGSMTVTRRLDDLEPASGFRVRLAAARPTDFDSHFAMAKLAADSGLLTQAGQQAREAMRCVEGKEDLEAKRATVRAWGAEVLEKMITDAIAAGDLDQARSCLKLLSTRLADQRTDEQIDALAQSVEGLEQKARDARAAARQAKLDEKARAANARKLDEVAKIVDKGAKDYGQAVRKSRNTTASKNLCESAVGHYKKAFLDLKELLEKHEGDADLAEAAEPLMARIHDEGIAAALHAANVLTVRSDYKGAMEWAQRVLAFDPDNDEAKEMVKTINIAAAAASSDWGWRWTIGGGRPVPDPRRF